MAAGGADAVEVEFEDKDKGVAPLSTSRWPMSTSGLIGLRV